ncbi:hypothetical protein J4573_02135 [Actinomadura barringtoniae]|uniref:Uncharacterized protein n=1 Tax=Actinomadura barringtoniae TaxID=1427535 RepID=A0A939PAU3_9ACTN|nr:hypothetical protein [Actinomadura barringtoniae]MBO2445879.1 hypothetical protein [Actinomadura barringtoniae]
MAFVGLAGGTVLQAVPAAAGPAPDPLKAAAEQAAQGCDPIDPAACLVPFPNDVYTVRDTHTDTGRRVAFKPGAMPRNILGKGIDPAEFNRNDGFSPGTPILVQLPGIDPAKTGIAPSTDIGGSLRADAPVVLVNAKTRQRQPYYAELDAQDPQHRTLIIRPAQRLDEGTRYLVALRNAKTATGAVIAPGAAFTALSKKTAPADKRLKPRWTALHATLNDLGKAGVGTRGLNLAWDFTTSSTRSLTGRALAMRDTAFDRLGKKAPKVLITSVKDKTEADDPKIARTVTGLIEVPSFLNPAGTELTYAKADPGPYDKPVAPTWRTYHAPFECNIPRVALKEKVAPVLYGHGLFGDYTVIDSDATKSLSNDNGLMMCATNWMGISGPDKPYLALLADLSNFRLIPDRMQQSYLNTLFLGRWLIHPQGAAAQNAFKVGDSSVLNPKAKLTYSGVSHGGIQGGALTALAQDFTTAVLSVPGMGFSTLLNRSSAFSSVQQVIDLPYPNKADQQIGFGLMQMLWDRGEANGYVAHLIKNPLPRTPVHRVLLHEAFGDDAVSNVTTENEARSLGIPVRQPALSAGRSNDVTPFWGIKGRSAFPYTGSMLVMWDSGAPVVPPNNLPPAPPKSPHDSTVRSELARMQTAHFLKTGGEVIDVCGGGPCVIPIG